MKDKMSIFKKGSTKLNTPVIPPVTKPTPKPPIIAPKPLATPVEAANGINEVLPDTVKEYYYYYSRNEGDESSQRGYIVRVQKKDGTPYGGQFEVEKLLKNSPNDKALLAMQKRAVAGVDNCLKNHQNLHVIARTSGSGRPIRYWIHCPIEKTDQGACGCGYSSTDSSGKSIIDPPAEPDAEHA